MRPYIICHMMASLDGRIDCTMTEQIEEGNEYYEALERLAVPSCLNGRTTMAIHYAEPEPYLPADPTPIGRPACHVAARAAGYTLSVDTKGTLQFASARIDDKPLLCIVSQQAPAEYLRMLESRGISWIAAGEKRIDLVHAVELLYSAFGVERMAVVGGGHINSAFLEAGLLDEVSMMYAPGIDGRGGMTAAFDGRPAGRAPVRLELKSVERFAGGTVWMRYDVR